ncbi:hypothetical protein CAV_0556 [Campylobacter avium LMG 24591]|uniref:Uncharacterized protein n=1 Tax=Campylobacter avium LMG 24591 TaxID=522484 RepID=A0A222MW89_9BACT|nr:hypothetical protein [Campylobacter avium]ASQ30223.1 hypothetical protein CAV_0556 [Campylobacter avium LMG 24591]OYD79321.1 hypothetical protein CAV8706_0558 [Campylobacter avium]
MPILDIRAGSAATANVNNATANLISAYMARSKGISEGISGIGKAFSDYAKTKDEMATNESKREHLDANTAEQKAQTELLNKTDENGVSIREKQINNEITKQGWQNTQLEQLLSKQRNGKSLYQQGLDANIDLSKSQENQNYANSNLIKAKAAGQNIDNAFNFTAHHKLVSSDENALGVYGNTLNGNKPISDFEYFKQTGTIRTPSKDGKNYTYQRFFSLR